MAQLPTLTDFKKFANITSSTNDAELSTHLDAAIELVEEIVGPLSPMSVTETHYGVSGRELVLRQAPVQSLTSVSAVVYPGQPAVTYSVADYAADAETGVLRSVYGLRLFGDVTITYLAGRSWVPAPVALAVLIVAGHLWETQRGPAPSPLALQSGEAPQPGWSGFAIPNRATDLLGPFRQLRVS